MTSQQTTATLSWALAIVILATAWSLTACAVQPLKPPAPPLTLHALKNAEYPTEYLTRGKAKLTDGKYQEPDFKVLITLDSAMAWGDLDDDGSQDAVVVLVSNTGGSSAFYHLQAVLNQNGQPRPVASTLLGDRVKIEAMDITSGVITVDLLTRATQDSLCCPTQKTRQSFRLQGSRLVQANDP